MSEERYATFEEFWPFYVREHARKTTRQLHFAGTTAAATCAIAYALTRKPGWLLAMPFAGYGPAWVSHFFIEKNRPATFKYPLWSLKADLVMWQKTLMGTMDDEVERATASVAPQGVGPSEGVEPSSQVRSNGSNGAPRASY
jgi:hypothetical protein